VTPRSQSTRTAFSLHLCENCDDAIIPRPVPGQAVGAAPSAQPNGKGKIAQATGSSDSPLPRDSHKCEVSLSRDIAMGDPRAAARMSNKHTPMTNLLNTETVVSGEQISPGRSGAGEIAEPAGEREFLAPVMAEFAPTASVAALPDIGLASFGERIQPEAVLGTDERVRVKATKQFPWRCLASLLITARDGSQWIGTAWFVSPRVLITAGHCVCIKGGTAPAREGWVKQIQVMPGRNESEMPFGSQLATEFWTVKGWGDSGEEAYDYGAIILPDAFPDDLGVFGFAVLGDSTLRKRIINVAGYPGDKPAGTLWHDSRAVANLSPDKVHYEADTAGGQSGAPVYLIQPDRQRVAVGIHAYGGASTNSATRISSQAYANIHTWINR
jgi:glutamyl endopeptidase